MLGTTFEANVRSQRGETCSVNPRPASARPTRTSRLFGANLTVFFDQLPQAKGQLGPLASRDHGPAQTSLQEPRLREISVDHICRDIPDQSERSIAVIEILMRIAGVALASGPSTTLL